MSTITEDYIKKYFDDKLIRNRMEADHDFSKLSAMIEQMIMDDVKA